MADHFRLQKYQILTAVSVSGTNTYTSSVTHILNLDDIGIQLNATGTPNGTFSIQVSIDYVQDAEGNVLNAGNWVPITGVSPALTGAAAQIYVDLNELSAPWIRVQYTNSSSSGVINGFICGKGLM